MIIDLAAFVARERPLWRELEQRLGELEAAPERRLALDEALRLYELERRAAADLAKLGSLPLHAELRTYLEALLARAHLELGGRPQRRALRERVFELFVTVIPRAFQRQLPAFWLALAVTALGTAFGAAAVAYHDRAKEFLLPFPELLGDPRDRVAREEASALDHGHAASFAAILMTNNISVAFRAFALGAFYGLGTLLIVLYNGVVLGAVAFDYVRASHTEFLLAWLLPHGAVEIPAILIAAQAGFVLGRAMLGRGDGTPLGSRLRDAGPDLAALLICTTLLLVWAGIVESFFSQFHAPLLPYAAKIAFGALELCLLGAYLFWPRRTGAAP